MKPNTFPKVSTQLTDVVPHLPSTGLPPAWRNLLCIGLMTMIAGMCAMPAGPSFNPSRPYQYLLGLTLYLPALIIGFVQPRRWLEFARRPLVPWLLVLFAWATLSLAWTSSSHPLDEFLRMLTVLTFLFACTQGVGHDLRRQRWLLIGGSSILAITATVAMVRFAFLSEDRLIGFGVMANPNLIGATLGAGILWLWPWHFEKPVQRLLKWLAMAVMASSLLLTQSRSAWIALYGTVFIMLSTRSREHVWLRVSLLCMVGLGMAVAVYPELIERGLSFRPQILSHAMTLFLEHPWRGSGLGANFVIPVNGGTGMYQVHTHNLWSQLAVELGLPGLLLWSMVWIGLGWRTWKLRHEVVGHVVFSLWLFASVMVQFDLPHLIDSPRPGWLILWLPLALSLSLPEATKSPPVR